MTESLNNQVETISLKTGRKSFMLTKVFYDRYLTSIHNHFSHISLGTFKLHITFADDKSITKYQQIVKEMIKNGIWVSMKKKKHSDSLEQHFPNVVTRHFLNQ